jgi:hypothetical protein
LTQVAVFCYASIDMKPFVSMLGILGTGFFVPACIILGVLGGRWLDEKYNSGSAWTIAGLIFGTIVAVYGTYNTLKPFIDSAKIADSNKKDKDSR